MVSEKKINIENNSTVIIAGKSRNIYLHATIFALENNDEIILSARGKYIEKAITIAITLQKLHIITFNTCNMEVWKEQFIDKENIPRIITCIKIKINKKEE